MDLSISPTSVYFLGSTDFISEDTPYQKIHLLLYEHSVAFFDDDILPNRNLYDNFRSLLNEVRDLTINFTFKKIEKNFTEKTLNKIKEKIKSMFSEAVKQMKKIGRTVPKAQPEEVSVFPSALGKYVKSKLMPLSI